MSSRQQRASNSPSNSTAALCFAVVAGLFFAIGLNKWANLTMIQGSNSAPEDLIQLVIFPWPISWLYGLLVPLVAAALFSFLSGKTNSVRQHEPLALAKWIPLLPLAWLAWQLVSSMNTVDRELTEMTLRHFSLCVLFFYLGFFSLRGLRNPWPLWGFLTAAFAWILLNGFDQHFGGLEATLESFKQQPDFQNAPPDLLKRMQKGRIYSTLFYANTLAGVILLLLPIILAFIWEAKARLSIGGRSFLMAAFGLAGLACLFWSGSKSGWLIFLIMAAVAWWRSTIGGRWRRWLICFFVIAGLVGFAVKYGDFFKKGSTSVVARFDYWRAALQTAKEHPVVGSGPGTFLVQYRQLKRLDAEPSRLCHNDYLQQASDSGIPGFLAFFGFITASLALIYKRGFVDGSQFNSIKFAVWLGLLGLSLHSLVEFHLYIYAIAYLWFFLFGWLWSRES